MNKKKKFLCRAGAILLLIAIAAVMFVIGRGHTVYFDNKTFEMTDGSEPLSALNRATVYVNGEKVAKLAKRERGMATCMGQKFSFDLEVMQNKGEEEVMHHFDITLPYNWDGIIVNLPALLQGLPQDQYQSLFVPATVEETAEEEEIVTDEFSIGDF